jgi:uncharacterized protein (TIRG00374 family)
MSGSKSARISFGLSLLLVFVMVVLLFIFVDIEQVAWQLRHADLRYLALAALMLLGGFGIYSLRWQLLLQRQPSLAKAFHASNLGNLVNMMLPMNPGDAIRIWLINRNSAISIGQGTSSIVIERMLENILRLVAFSGMLVIGMGFFTRSMSILIGLVGFLGFALTVLIWMLKNQQRVLNSWPRFLARLPRLSQEKVYQTLIELLDALAAMSSPRQLAEAILTSLLTWGFYFGVHYFTLQALNLALTQQQMLALSLGTLMMIPPSSPALPGVFHAQIVLPFAALGISSSYLTAYAIVLHAVEAGLIVSLGALALLVSGTSLNDFFDRTRIAAGSVAVPHAAGD